MQRQNLNFFFRRSQNSITIKKNSLPQRFFRLNCICVVSQIASSEITDLILRIGSLIFLPCLLI